MADIIFKRISVREFKNEAVDDGRIEKLMRAAMAAPSATNQRPWEFFYTTDPHITAQLAQASPYAKPADGAPLVIVPCYRATGMRLPELVPYDMAISCENILLEAVELGLGGVWLGIAPFEERMSAVEKAIGTPEGLRAFALIPIGVPLVERAQLDRYDASRVHRIG